MDDVVHVISADPESGATVGSDGVVTVTMLEPGRMFKRRAVKAAGTPDARLECWLVAELNGVRVYQRGNEVVVTTQDLNP